MKTFTQYCVSGSHPCITKHLWLTFSFPLSLFLPLCSFSDCLFTLDRNASVNLIVLIRQKIFIHPRYKFIEYTLVSLNFLQTAFWLLFTGGFAAVCGFFSPPLKICHCLLKQFSLVRFLCLELYPIRSLFKHNVRWGDALEGWAERAPTNKLVFKRSWCSGSCRVCVWGVFVPVVLSWIGATEALLGFILI